MWNVTPEWDISIWGWRFGMFFREALGIKTLKSWDDATIWAEVHLLVGSAAQVRQRT